jgi:transcriptional regulator with XRE-family HTH domain
MGMDALAGYLAELRTSAGLTQKQAASLVSSVRVKGQPLSYKTVERWEQGKHEPTLTLLRAYVKALGGSIDRAVALLLSRATEKPDEELTPEELEFFSSLSPERRRLMRQFIEADRRDLD